MANLVTPGIRFIESLMVDECRIDRDYRGVNDDILDEVTGLLVKPANDKTVVYSGKCILTPLDRKELEYTNANEPLFRKMYRVLIPLSVSDVRLGDVFTLTASGPSDSIDEHDQLLLETPMRVQMIVGGTFRGCRSLRVEDIRKDHGVTRQ